jgi:hypothetical protein
MQYSFLQFFDLISSTPKGLFNGRFVISCYMKCRLNLSLQNFTCMISSNICFTQSCKRKRKKEKKQIIKKSSPQSLQQTTTIPPPPLTVLSLHAIHFLKKTCLVMVHVLICKSILHTILFLCFFVAPTSRWFPFPFQLIPPFLICCC